MVSKYIHQSKPRLQASNTRDNMFKIIKDAGTQGETYGSQT